MHPPTETMVCIEFKKTAMMIMMRHKRAGLREILYWVRVTELTMPLLQGGGLISSFPPLYLHRVPHFLRRNPTLFWQDASCAFTHARTQRRSALYQAPERRSRDRVAPPGTWAPCYQVRSPGRGVHAIVPPAQQDKREGEAAQHVVVVGQTNAIRTSA